LLVALDVHPRVAMQILRHSRITVTMDVYSEVPSEATQEALRRLGESLDGWLLLHIYCCTEINKGRSHVRNRPLTWS
jgi:hypothetical protein